MDVWTVVLVFVGSALGGACRWMLAAWVDGVTPGHFPVGTLVVNASGALLIGVGWVALLAAPLGTAVWIAPLFLKGFLGGYTTVSGFCQQTLQLVLAGDLREAFLNVAGSYALCLVCVFLGAAAGKVIFGI
ncbi:MAG: CrcB family protein [Opitutales bacterium]|nr:CrcB family protein [Opitutales bacterium]